MIRRPPRSPLFPSTTLSRSREDDPILVTGERHALAPGAQDGGGPNEDAVERRVEAIDDEVRLERLPLPPERVAVDRHVHEAEQDRKSTRLNSSHSQISYAVF